jgi:nucleoside-triphosphatase THEP1
MNLAYTMAPGRGDTDLILEKLARALNARGMRCCGTVQINTQREDSRPCDMDVCVLPNGPVLRISQDLGPIARGCRLDPAALETAVELVSQSLTRDTDLLIINKFGKHEAEGRGFRPIIAEAIAMDVPVLVGVNSLNLEAFETFAGGMALKLRPELAALDSWATRLSAKFSQRNVVG